MARAGDCTFDHLLDRPDGTYELLDGEAEVLPGMHVIPTPGHVVGHQSIVVECAVGSVVPAWMARLLSFDPRRLVFAHDAAVWTP